MSYKQLIQDDKLLQLKTEQLAIRLLNLKELTNNLLNRMEEMRSNSEQSISNKA